MDVFFPIAVMGIMGLISLLCFAFWVWMLVECLTKEPSEGNDKIIWLLVIVLANGLGAILYFFIRRPQRLALERHGGRNLRY